MSWTRAETTIGVGADALAVDVYRPRTGEPRARVVMANGLSLRRRDGLPRFAEAFAADGYEVVAFDYRCFGDSDGTPRQWLDARRQRADLAAVLDHCLRGTALPTVLWGYSFGGGHVLAELARRGVVAAAVATAPYVSVLAAARRLPIRTNLALTRLAVADEFAARAGRAPVLVPLVADGSRCVVDRPDAADGFAAITADGWTNAVTARFALRALPTGIACARLRRVRAPVLVCAAEYDQVIPHPAIARRAAALPHGRLRSYPSDHFGILGRADVLADQRDFLARVLGEVSA